MEFRTISLEKIDSSKGQARKIFRENSLNSLARSLDEIGQIQPVVVKENGDAYTLVAGERRVRALAKKGREEVLALVLSGEVGEERCRLIQLAENLHREDLNPLERAQAIKEYMEEENLSKQEASRRLGLPRTTLSEWLNILQVSEYYQQKVLENFYGKDSPLTLSHISLARALESNSKDPTRGKVLLDQVIKFNLSRGETRRVVEMCSRDPLLPVEEGVAIILIQREQKKPADQEEKEKGEPGEKELSQAFTRLQDLIEELLDNPGGLPRASQKVVMEEFIYLYQLLHRAVPGLRQKILLLDVGLEEEVK